MSNAQLIRLAVLLSIMLIVFGFALRSTAREGHSQFPAIGIALVAVSVSPVPPFLQGKQLKLVTHRDYVIGLLRASSLLTCTALRRRLPTGRVPSRESSVCFCSSPLSCRCSKPCGWICRR